MGIKMGYLSPVGAAAAIAVAILAAPVASAAPDVQPSAHSQPSCVASGGGTTCQSPGNVQINDAPPPAQFYPYGGEAFLL
ncbi:hypothetical protein A5784_18095 [Mycobacterium sp. 852013-50091_SCH5140682]|uniref:hypothetical protein n=1 Tax=Mycobacterium sp. 852013-50091_SCH5140682 TaxID=1834109 RepID=UPI0007EAA430|nr:hypothetical protein [Mycobacterium sp. 852013-50091_SCH5140682]OBC01626.1 hypothetical protein A5784_18095 [Mycobacterium sp. 852013-50091_SCH5140682]